MIMNKHIIQFTLLSLLLSFFLPNNLLGQEAITLQLDEVKGKNAWCYFNLYNNGVNTSNYIASIEGAGQEVDHYLYEDYYYFGFKPTAAKTDITIKFKKAIQRINFSNQALSQLNCSKASSLRELDITDNRLSAEAMNKLILSLPNRQGKQSGVLYVNSQDKENSHREISRNIITKNDVALAKSKNWLVKKIIYTADGEKLDPKTKERYTVYKISFEEELGIEQGSPKTYPKAQEYQAPKGKTLLELPVGLLYGSLSFSPEDGKLVDLGSEVKIKALPHRGYFLKSLMVNGENVLAKMSFKAKANNKIVAEFAEGENHRLSLRYIFDGGDEGIETDKYKIKLFIKGQLHFLKNGASKLMFAGEEYSFEPYLKDFFNDKILSVRLVGKSGTLLKEYASNKYEFKGINLPEDASLEIKVKTKRKVVQKVKIPNEYVFANGKLELEVKEGDKYLPLQKDKAYPLGAIIRIKVKADDGYKLDKLSVNSKDLTNSEEKIFLLAETNEIKAVFKNSTALEELVSTEQIQILGRCVKLSEIQHIMLYNLSGLKLYEANTSEFYLPENSGRFFILKLKNRTYKLAL